MWMYPSSPHAVPHGVFSVSTLRVAVDAATVVLVTFDHFVEVERDRVTQLMKSIFKSFFIFRNRDIRVVEHGFEASDACNRTVGVKSALL